MGNIAQHEASSMAKNAGIAVKTRVLTIPYWAGHVPHFEAEVVPKWVRVADQVAPYWCQAGLKLEPSWAEVGGLLAETETDPSAAHGAAMLDRKSLQLKLYQSDKSVCITCCQTTAPRHLRCGRISINSYFCCASKMQQSQHGQSIHIVACTACFMRLRLFKFPPSAINYYAPSLSYHVSDHALEHQR